jgi:hypothetical protein
MEEELGQALFGHYLKVDNSPQASFCFYKSEFMMTISSNRIGMTGSLYQIKQLN